MTKEDYNDDTMLLPRGTRLIVQRLPAARGQGLVARFARADAGLAVQSAPTVRYGNQLAAESGYYTVQNHDEDEFLDVNRSDAIGSNNNANANADLKSSLGVNHTAAAAIAAPDVTSASSTSNYTNINNNMNMHTLQVQNGPHTTSDDNDDEMAKLNAILPGQTNASYGSNPMTRSAVQPPKFSSNPTSISASSSGINQHANNKFKHNPHHLLQQNNYPQRPNADPTLREMEQQQQQLEGNQKSKKKTGIPRTFHQPDDNKNCKAFETGFNQLRDRGGGQSVSASGKKMDLEYALQLTATTIPEHLQCGICAQVAKDALFIPWDEDGRTACDLCMRKGLSENRLRCPLTGQDGVSPDDLKPNKGLRKAVDVFVKGVMEKMAKIVKQKEVDDELEREEEEKKKAMSMNKEEEKMNEYEGNLLERGAILNRGMIKKNVKKIVEDDDFGGDVFDVTREEEETNGYEEENHAEEQNLKEKNGTNGIGSDDVGTRIGDNMKEIEDNTISKNVAADDDNVEKSKNVGENTDSVTTNAHSKNDVDSSSILQSQQHQQHDENNKSIQNRNEIHNNNSPDQPQSNTRPMSPKTSSNTVVNRREMLKNRGPPAGYVMGPAGANQTNPLSSSSNVGGRGNQHRNYQGRGRGSYNGGRVGGQHYGGRGVDPPINVAVKKKQLRRKKVSISMLV